MGFAVIPSEEISHRVDFALLANARGYLDAVEVGVDTGIHARDFLARFNGNWLIGVDPYAPFAEFPYDRTGDLMSATLALMPFLGRFRIVRGRSPDCIPWVRSVVSPDFVYIDGSHEERDVFADLEGWWGAIPPHGMIAGHDYDGTHPGVCSAVDRFARDRGLVVRLTHEPVTPSWYMYKTEPETLKINLFRHDELPNPRSG